METFEMIQRKKKKAREILDKFQELSISGTKYIAPYDFAIINVGLGELDQAFEWLNKAYENCDALAYTVIGSGLLKPYLGSDPRYIELRKKLGFDN